MSLRQSVTSFEYVKVGPVTTGTDDPTGDDVEMAFLDPADTPEEADWEDAEWATVGGNNSIQRLVYGGNVVNPPGGATVLDAGTFVVWVRIHDNPETPARPADVLVMYEASV